MVKTKLIHEFHVWPTKFNGRKMWIVTLNTEIQSKQICRILSKLQEIKKPTYLVRELSRLRKLEKENEKKKFTCRLIDQWKTILWRDEVCMEEPRTSSAQQGNSWKVVREDIEERCFCNTCNGRRRRPARLCHKYMTIQVRTHWDWPGLFSSDLGEFSFPCNLTEKAWKTRAQVTSQEP